MSRTSAIILPLIFCTIVYTNCSHSQWIVVRCSEDDVTLKVPKNASASYRLYGSRYETAYRSTLSALGTVISKRPASDSLKGTLVEFRTYLGKERGAIQAQLRKSVTRVQKDPCDTDMRKAFHFLLENININARRLNNIVVACKDTSVDLGGLMHEYTRDEE